MNIDNLLAGALGSLGGSLFGALVGGVVTYNVMNRHDRTKLMMDMELDVSNELIDKVFKMKKNMVNMNEYINGDFNNLVSKYKMYEQSTLEEKIYAGKNLWSETTKSYLEISDLFQRRQHILNNYIDFNEKMICDFKSLKEILDELFLLICKLLYKKMIKDISLSKDEVEMINSLRAGFEDKQNSIKKILEELVLCLQNEFYQELCGGRKKKIRKKAYRN